MRVTVLTEQLLAEITSLWEPIPVGVDENGQIVCVSLPERNLLLGGEPGAGKSAALSLLVATAALDPHCVLWLLDGKLVELAAWNRCARRSVGVDVGEAVEVLEDLREEMDRRYEVLLAAGKRKVSREDGLPLHVVVVDELAHYLMSGERSQQRQFAELSRDLVSCGRAAGIIFLGATQKPSGDVISTFLRDLFGFRWALRCTTRDASDTILGAGWASNGYDAATVDPDSRGVGFLLAEGGVPVRLRSYYLSDDDITVLSARGAALRSTGLAVKLLSRHDPVDDELDPAWAAYAANYQARHGLDDDLAGDGPDDEGSEEDAWWDRPPAA